MEDRNVYRAICNDRRCQTVLFISNVEERVECFQCGQVHERGHLRDVQEVMNHEQETALVRYVQRLIITRSLPKRGTEMVKVLGLSNYYCKLLSPLLTIYGMDNKTGQAKLLRDMNLGDILDCSAFSDRAFLIEPEHIDIPGFGRDVTGSMTYLAETLKLIVSSNGGEERLLPIHADGDGHCLVHAISRALVGRELFWHPLRCCLKRHFETSLDKFKELFKDFIDTDEWPSIIEECDPDFKPPEGELHGLRNIHIFGLANVLKRPIILLDSLDCMNKCGDYSALFLPGFIDPEDCKGKDNLRNKPICIAWSSYSHNHYIPLVGVQKMSLPVLPSTLLPKVWGMPQSSINSYIEFDADGNCTIGGSKVLSDGYIQRLAIAMESQFIEQFRIHPSLVADTKLYLCSNNVLLNTKVITVIQKARSIVAEGRLFRCLTCMALCQIIIDPGWLRRGGFLYKIALQQHKKFSSGGLYLIPSEHYRVFCKYDLLNDALVPEPTSFMLNQCSYCTSVDIRKVRANGSLVGLSVADSSEIKSSKKDEDFQKASEKTPETTNMLTLTVKWNNAEVSDIIPDFQLVSKEGLGVAVASISAAFIKKHFPEDTDNVPLQTYIAEEILRKIGKSTLSFTPPSESVENPMEIEKSNKVESEKSNEVENEKSNEVENEKSNEVENEKSNEVENEKSNQVEVEKSNKMEVEMDDTAAKKNALNIDNSRSNKPPTPCVKVVSLSGQQANLDLGENGITFPQLQNWIEKEFNIPVSNQKIKIGFPPKELEAPNLDSHPLSLKHGDRLMIENCPKLDSNRHSSAPYIRSRPSQTSTYTPYQSEIMWNIAKMTPDRFRKGGEIYEEVFQSRIQYDLIHFKIPVFPTKHFSYNTHTDSIELCFKPWGHFEISPEMDSRIEQVQAGEKVAGHRNCPVMSLKPGQVVPLLNKTVKKTLPPSTETTAETHPPPLLRKGPGFSILTSPETPENMDLS